MQGLLAEISRKKKANADLRSKAGSVEATTTSEAAAFNVSSKFIRRGDKKVRIAAVYAFDLYLYPITDITDLISDSWRKSMLINRTE